MDSFVFLILMFLVGGVLQTLAKRKQQQGRQRRPARPPVEAGDEPKDLLAAIRRAYQQAERQRPTPGPGIGLPKGRDDSLEEMIEETESLEIEPETQSLEEMQTRPERAIVDQDDAVEETLIRRLKWAEEHAKPISPTDHRKFDQAIRAPKPAAPIALDPADRLAELRKMVVWREVFGPPKSLQ